MTSTAAQQLDLLAHELRNRVNVLSLGVGLVAERELAEDLGDATGALRRMLERLVVLARIELGERPLELRCTVQQLLQLGASRARREGSELGLDPGRVELRGDEVGERQLAVPGTWAERLMADLLHLLEGDTAVVVTARPAAVDVAAAVLELVQQTPAPNPAHGERVVLEDAVRAMAAGIGGSCIVLREPDGCVRVRLLLPVAD